MVDQSILGKVVKVLRKRGMIGSVQYVIFRIKYEVLGRFVEFSGNRVKIDGLTIDVDTPILSLLDKSLAFQQRFELPERNAIKQYLDRLTPVIELGGNIGVVACTTNALLAEPNQHVVVEAHPILAEKLDQNRTLNQCQFSIINKAVAYDAETIEFYEHGTSSGIKEGSKAAAVDRYEVQTISLEAIMQEFSFEVFSLVCDIEGAEEDLVEREVDILAKHVKHFFVELHPLTVGTESRDKTIMTLERAGFKQIWKENEVYVFANEHLNTNKHVGDRNP